MNKLKYGSIAKVDETFEEKKSGKNVHSRPIFKQCLNYLRKDDILVVASIDRAARSLQDLLSIVKDMEKRGVTVEFVKEGLKFVPGDTDPMSELTLSLLGSIAQFERALINERQMDGIVAAKKRGVQFGRKSKFSNQQCIDIYKRATAKESKAQLAKEFGVGRKAIYAAIERAKTLK